MKRRRPRLGGLEAFGLTLEQLIELGSRPVTFEIHIATPPDVYPSKARLRWLLRESPQRRRALVHAWRVKKYDRLRAEVPFASDAYERIEFNGDPVGMRVTAPAATIGKLSRLQHAQSVQVKGIHGRRARRPRRASEQLYAVKARFVTQVEGQRTGLQEIEDRIIVVMASSRARAELQVRRLCAKDEGVTLLTSGHFRRRVFEKVLDVCEAPDDAFDPAGTEVYYEFAKRRLARRDAWPSRARSEPKPERPDRRPARRRIGSAARR